jgi:hypothetical protein
MCLSSIVFIIIIGIYDKFEYGLPLFYERSFLYLFLLVSLVGAIGLSEIRKTIKELIKKINTKKIRFLPKKFEIYISIILSIIIIITVVPAHTNILYYKMITEEEYNSYTWIKENIDIYRNETYLYDRAAINPYKASPFSGLTGLYIVSSIMNPVYGYRYYKEFQKFLNNKCIDTEFLIKHNISVVYGNCENPYLTMIHPNVYLYPDLYKNQT